MLENLFSPDGPIVSFIFRVRDLVVLNIIAIICMIPVFTIGPSLKALAFTSLKIVRKEDGNVVRTFFKNFKINFGQSVLFGLVCLLFMAIGAGDIIALIYYRKIFSPMLMLPAIIALLLLASVLVFAVPMQGRFLNPIGRTFRNAFWASLTRFHKTLLMLLEWLIIPSFIYFVSGNFVPLFFAMGLSLPAYLNALVYEPLFREVEESIAERDRTESESSEQ